MHAYRGSRPPTPSRSKRRARLQGVPARSWRFWEPLGGQPRPYNALKLHAALRYKCHSPRLRPPGTCSCPTALREAWRNLTRLEDWMVRAPAPPKMDRAKVPGQAGKKTLIAGAPGQAGKSRRAAAPGQAGDARPRCGLVGLALGLQRLTALQHRSVPSGPYVKVMGLLQAKHVALALRASSSYRLASAALPKRMDRAPRIMHNALAVRVDLFRRFGSPVLAHRANLFLQAMYAALDRCTDFPHWPVNAVLTLREYLPLERTYAASTIHAGHRYRAAKGGPTHRFSLPLWITHNVPAYHMSAQHLAVSAGQDLLVYLRTQTPRTAPHHCGGAPPPGCSPRTVGGGRTPPWSGAMRLRRPLPGARA